MGLFRVYRSFLVWPSPLINVVYFMDWSTFVVNPRAIREITEKRKWWRQKKYFILWIQNHILLNSKYFKWSCEDQIKIKSNNWMTVNGPYLNVIIPWNITRACDVKKSYYAKKKNVCIMFLFSLIFFFDCLNDYFFIFVRFVLILMKQDKSSDIEQQPPLDDRK